jgi:Ala-tRNA(Pro) deacylase
MAQASRKCNTPHIPRPPAVELSGRSRGAKPNLIHASNPQDLMPAGRADLLAFLETHGISTSTVEHPPLFTVEQAQALRGEIHGGHTKNLFLKDKKDQVFLVVAEEDAAIDMKRLHKRIDSARLSFGSAALLTELLGVVPGSVTPFGVINDPAARVAVVLDAALLRHEELNFHPLENTATTTIHREDFLAFLRHAGHAPRILAVSGVDPE